MEEWELMELMGQSQWKPCPHVEVMTQDNIDLLQVINHGTTYMGNNTNDNYKKWTYCDECADH